MGMESQEGGYTSFLLSFVMSQKTVQKIKISILGIAAKATFQRRAIEERKDEENDINVTHICLV